MSRKTEIKILEQAEEIPCKMGKREAEKGEIVRPPKGGREAGGRGKGKTRHPVGLPGQLAKGSQPSGEP